MQLIGLTGKAGVGKSTVRQMIVDIFATKNILTGKGSFAAPIRDMVAAMTGTRLDLTKSEIKHRFVPGFDFTYRKLLQVLGTEVGRHLDEDIWVKLAKDVDELVTTIDDNAIIIYDDVRFENEAAYIREHGILIHLARGMNTTDEHTSEAGVEFVFKEDLFIHNHPGLSLASLNEEVYDLLKISGVF